MSFLEGKIENFSMLFGFNIFIQITSPRFSWFTGGKNYEEVVLELSLDATACPCKSCSTFWVLAAVARENLQLFATDPTGRKEHMDWVCAQSGKKQAGGFTALLLFCYSTARWAASCTCRLLEGVGSNEWEDKDCHVYVGPGLWPLQVLPFGADSNGQHHCVKAG